MANFMRTGKQSGRGENASRGRGFPPFHRRKPRQAGFTLLGLLFLVALLGLLLAAAGTTWRAATQREKEAELLFIGDQYRRALTSYYQLEQGPEKHYPKKLEDLLYDPRFPNTVRHLRRPWPDPISGDDWVLVRDEEGGIKGVHSPSTAKPRKTAGFSREYAAFEDAGHYADWVFVAGKQTEEGSAGGGGAPAPATLPASLNKTLKDGATGVPR